VNEHIELYARIKGFKGAALNSEMETRVQALGLKEFEQSRAGQLSGGNKRKLSCAIATLGEPDIVFLDEPSAGMDPAARRFMWNVIQGMAQKRKTSAVLLTTHSMDEADALCSRIAIQCSGQVRCLGTPQQLKEWYGTGLELNVRLAVPDCEDVKPICAHWGFQPEYACPSGKAKTLVDAFLTSKHLRSREPPISGRADSVATGALAEWCMQQVRVDTVHNFLIDKCGGEEHVQCVEQAAGSLRYRLLGNCAGGGPLPYVDIFEMLQQNRDSLGLADFHLSQSTLEQTFNRLAAEDNERNGKSAKDD